MIDDFVGHHNWTKTLGLGAFFLINVPVFH
jgi:hypothetical protein